MNEKYGSRSLRLEQLEDRSLLASAAMLWVNSERLTDNFTGHSSTARDSAQLARGDRLTQTPSFTARHQTTQTHPLTQGPRTNLGEHDTDRLNRSQSSTGVSNRLAQTPVPTVTQWVLVFTQSRPNPQPQPARSAVADLGAGTSFNLASTFATAQPSSARVSLSSSFHPDPSSLTAPTPEKTSTSVSDSLSVAEQADTFKQTNNPRTIDPAFYSSGPVSSSITTSTDQFAGRSDGPTMMAIDDTGEITATLADDRWRLSRTTWNQLQSLARPAHDSRLGSEQQASSNWLQDRTGLIVLTAQAQIPSNTPLQSEPVDVVLESMIGLSRLIAVAGQPGEVSVDGTLNTNLIETIDRALAEDFSLPRESDRLSSLAYPVITMVAAAGVAAKRHRSRAKLQHTQQLQSDEPRVD